MKRDHHMGVAGAKKEDCKFVNGALAKIAPVSGTTGEIVGAAAAKSVSDTESAGSKELEVAPAQQEVQQKAVEIGESSSSSSESHSSESSSSGSSSSGSSSSSSSSGSGGSGSSGSESHQSESHESGSNDSGSSSSSSSSGSNGSGSSGSESHQSGSHSSGSNQSGSSSYTSTSSAPSPTKAISSGKGFSRIAFYDAKAGVSQGLVFLNHKGGQGSGTFDR